MNMKRNLMDNMIESELKLGYWPNETSFYYPVTSLYELLGTDESGLEAACNAFAKELEADFGKIRIYETEEKGRYCVSVPEKGVTFVHETERPTDFLVDFIVEIKRPGNTLEDMVMLFQRHGQQVSVQKETEKEWAVYYKDQQPDPYVYLLEVGDFGLEYHRFTHAAYEQLIQNLLT